MPPGDGGDEEVEIAHRKSTSVQIAPQSGRVLGGFCLEREDLETTSQRKGLFEQTTPPTIPGP